MSDQIQELNDEISRLSKIQDDIINSNNVEQLKNEEFIKINSQLEKDIGDKQKDLDKIGADTIYAKSEADKILKEEQDKLVEARKKNDELDSLIENKKSSLSGLDDDYNKEVADLQQSYTDQESSLKDDIKKLLDEIDSNTISNNDLLKKIDDNTNELSDLTSQIPSKQSTLDGLTADISIKQAVLDDINNNIISATAKLDKITADTQAEIDKFNEAVAPRDGLVKEIADLTTQRDAKKKELDSLESQLFAIADKQAKVDQAYAELAPLYKRAGVIFPYEQ